MLDAKRCWSFMLIFGIALLLFWPVFFAPMQGDSALYAYIGDGILDGYAPYKDAWDIKSPLIYFQYAAALAVWRNETAAHVADWLLAVAAAAAVFAAARRLAGAEAGFVAGLSWVICYHAFVLKGGGGQPETAAAALGSSIFVLAIRAGPLRRRDSLLGGLLAALLLAYKLPFAILALLLVPRLLAARRLRAALDGVWPGFVASIALLGLLSAYFVSHDALGEFYEGALVTAVRTAGEHAPVARQISLFTSGLFVLCTRLAGPAAFAVVGLIACVRGDKPGRLLVGYFVISLLLVVLQRKYWPYHWITILPAMSILAGVGAARVGRLFDGLRIPRVMRTAALSVLLIVIGVDFRLGSGPSLLDNVMLAPTPRLAWMFWRMFAAGGGLRGEREGFWSAMRADFTTPQHALHAGVPPRLARRLSESVPPGGTILCFNLDPGINFYARRRSPTRFLYLWIFEMEAIQSTGWREEFANSIITGRPVFILICRENAREHGRDELAVIYAWPRLGAWFRTHYEKIEIIGPLEIYRLVDVAVPGS